MARNYKKGRISHKNLTWRDRYNIYLRDYERQERKMERADTLMAHKKYSSLKEYKDAYEDMVEQRREEGKTRGNINQYLVREQAYSYSMKVGGGVLPYLIEAGDVEEPTTLQEKARLIMKIRQGEFLESEGFWNAVRDRREELYKEYGKYRHSDANKQISREFFGSK